MANPHTKVTKSNHGPGKGNDVFVVYGKQFNKLVQELNESEKGVKNSITAASGSTQATGVLLDQEYNIVTVSATAGDSVTLDVPDEAGVKRVILNSGANSIDIFPAVGATIDDESANVAISLAAESSIELISTGTLAWQSLGVTSQQQVPASIGSGFDGAATAVWTYASKDNNVIVSECYIDLTDLIVSTTLADIIGESAAAANCHFGQVTTANMGTPFYMEILCLEVPAGAVDDIDFYSATQATGAENALVTSLDETLMYARGTSWAKDDVVVTTTPPVADQYLYLSAGAGGGAGTYTAGKFKVTIVGTI